MLMMIFGQSSEGGPKCDSEVCAIPGTFFGASAPEVMRTMHRLAPDAKSKVLDGGTSIEYFDYKIGGAADARIVLFVFVPDKGLEEVSTWLTPAESGNHYPEVLNLYFELRDAIQSTGLYDSIEFMYSFKNPYHGTTEKEAMAGNFSGDEEAALIQDRNGILGKYRFAKVWAVFQNKRSHSKKLTISVGYDGQGDFGVSMEYYDNSLSSWGYVCGNETTYTRK